MRIDWFALISLMLAVFAFFRIDWKVITNRMADNRGQQALLLLIIGSLAMSAVSWYRSSYRDLKEWPGANQETVYGRTYANEQVEIDGKVFDHCKFENVKLMFHGLAPSSFNVAQFNGKNYLLTDNRVVKGYEQLRIYFGQQMVSGTSFSTDENGTTTAFP